MAHYTEQPEHVLSTLDLLRWRSTPLIVAVSGPPLSGKTWLVRAMSSALGPLSLQEAGRPSFLSLDDFVGVGARKLFETTGLGVLHPRAYDVESLREAISALISKGHYTMVVQVYNGEKMVEREKRYYLPPGGVVIVEGLYACSLLEDVADACVYVEVPKRLELIMRRIVRVAYGLGTEDAIEASSLSELAWEIYGEGQKKLADILFFNRYRVLEDVGRPSYQLKICLRDLERKEPELAREVVAQPLLSVEDFVATEGLDRIRVRLTGKGVEVSYRYPLSRGFPYLRTVKYSLDGHLLPALLVSIRIAGIRIKRREREISFLEREGVTFKYYPDVEVVELETSDHRALEPYVEEFRGAFRLKSYYSGGRLCG